MINEMSTRRPSVTNGKQKGIALITALLILMLVSSVIIGLSWMAMHYLTARRQ